MPRSPSCPTVAASPFPAQDDLPLPLLITFSLKVQAAFQPVDALIRCFTPGPVTSIPGAAPLLPTLEHRGTAYPWDTPCPTAAPHPALGRKVGVGVVSPELL